MSAREWEQAKPAHRERRMPIMNEVHDIRSMEGYRKNLSQDFWFSGLINEQNPAKQDEEHEVRI